MVESSGSDAFNALELSLTRRTTQCSLVLGARVDASEGAVGDSSGISSTSEPMGVGKEGRRNGYSYP